MSGEAPEGIPLDVWLVANWVDVACQKNSCRDEGCNGFLCARAIRATYERGVRDAEKAAATVGRPVGAGDGDTYIPGTSSDAVRAIRQLLEVKG